MPRFGVKVRVWDEGGFVIKAASEEIAEEVLGSMERDEIESLCHFRKGDYSADLENEELDPEGDFDLDCDERWGEMTGLDGCDEEEE